MQNITLRERLVGRDRVTLRERLLNVGRDRVGRRRRREALNDAAVLGVDEELGEIPLVAMAAGGAGARGRGVGWGERHPLSKARAR